MPSAGVADCITGVTAAPVMWEGCLLYLLRLWATFTARSACCMSLCVCDNVFVSVGVGVCATTCVSVYCLHCAPRKRTA
jgi:hypothetical protein